MPNDSLNELLEKAAWEYEKHRGNVPIYDAMRKAIAIVTQHQAETVCPCVVTSEAMQDFSAVHALIGYCESLKPGTVITEDYVERLKSYYVPNVKKAAQALAEPVRASGQEVTELLAAIAEVLPHVRTYPSARKPRRRLDAAIAAMGEVPPIYPADKCNGLSASPASNTSGYPVAGWKLVPIVPTEAMKEAAFDALELSSPSHGYKTGTEARNAVYTAMLNAAPEPPVNQREIPVVDRQELVSEAYWPIERALERQADGDEGVDAGKVASQVIDKILPYFRSSEPVSVIRCAMALQGNHRIKLGSDLQQIAKVVLDTAGVKYVE